LPSRAYTGQAARRPAGKILFHDLETRSRIDLKNMGTHRYAVDPSTSVLCVGYAIGDSPVKLWTPSDPVPAPFIEAARNDDWVIIAHNANFERCITQHVLMPRYAWPEIPLAQWRCSMAMAYASALPGKLEKAAEALDLPYQKDADGARLMRTLSKPRADGTFVDDLELLGRLYDYCKNDVEVERALFMALPPLPASEQRIWEIDQTINERGFHIDGELLDAAHRVVVEGERRLLAEFHELTKLDSPAQVTKLIAWLADHGCEVSDLQKATLSAALRRKGLSDEVRRVIELRRALAHASAAKIETLLAWQMADSRVRGTLAYHGAATGRWVGRGPQPQNFKRDGERIAEKIDAILAGGEGLESPIEVVGDITRALICASPGHRLLIADFSGVESRVLAWIAGEHNKLEMWKKFDHTGDPRDDPYFIGGRMIGHPEAAARAAGKIADLAFGFQGGVGAWKNFAPADDTSDEETIKRYRDAWRAAHPATVQFWYAVDKAAIKAVEQPGVEHKVGKLTFRYDQRFLRLTLPAGRAISYPFPRIAQNRFDRPCLMFKDSAGGKFVDCKFGQGAYGGLLTENIVSGIARDLLAAALMRLEGAGYPIVLHVHDEVVVEVPNGFGSVEEFRRLVEFHRHGLEAFRSEPTRERVRASRRAHPHRLCRRV
jgi:DNA polymerase